MPEKNDYPEYRCPVCSIPMEFLSAWGFSGVNKTEEYECSECSSLLKIDCAGRALFEAECEHEDSIGC